MKWHSQSSRISFLISGDTVRNNIEKAKQKQIIYFNIFLWSLSHFLGWHTYLYQASFILTNSYCPSSIQGQTRQFYSLKTLTPPLLSLAPLLPLRSPCCHSFGPGSAIPSRSPCSNFPRVSLCFPEALPSTKTVRFESPPSVSPAHPDSLFTMPAHLSQCPTPSPLLLSIPVLWNHYTQCSEGLALPSLCHSVQATCPLYQEHFLL